MEPSLSERSAAVSDCGRRSLNEDAVLVAALPGGRECVAVADGMGGLAAGDVASRCALDTLRSALAGGAALDEAVHAANRAVLEEATSRGSAHAMGTTLVALLRDGRSYALVNVGDSRAYRIDRAGVQQLTRDHSFVAEAVQAGQLSMEEASRSRWRNAVTRAVGTEPAVQVDCLGPFELAEPHIVLLCTDGLYRAVPDDALRGTVLNARSPAEAVDALVREALDAGADDNVSAALILFDAASVAGEPQAPAPDGWATAHGGSNGTAHPQPRPAAAAAEWNESRVMEAVPEMRFRPRRRPEPHGRWKTMRLAIIVTAVLALTAYLAMLRVLI